MSAVVQGTGGAAGVPDAGDSGAGEVWGDVATLAMCGVVVRIMGGGRMI